MDFLKTYLAVLGGTATAMLVIGFFGKTLLEHWFKKDFANYDAKLKEDFKRYENKLDAIASKDETKFTYLHPERAKSAMQIYTMGVELEQTIGMYKVYWNLAKHNPERFSKDVAEIKKTSLNALMEMDDYVYSHKVYFELQMLEALDVFLICAKMVFKDETNVDVSLMFDKVPESLQRVESQIKILLGVADERK